MLGWSPPQAGPHPPARSAAMSAPRSALPASSPRVADRPTVRQALGRALVKLAGMVAVNSLIAVALTLLTPSLGHFTEHLVYSQSIGLLVFALVKTGRRWLWRDGDPSGAAMLAVIVAGVAGGLLGGSALAAWLLGHAWMMVRDDARHALLPALVTTVLATAVYTMFYRDRQRLARLRLQAERDRVAAERERASAEAARRAEVDAQLRLLRAQLEPHMLFNTLANLRALIGIDAAAAQAMLDRLIDYLRATLSASRREHCRLADEFALLDDYLSLIAVRMGARLRYALTVPAELASLPVPAMLLQPVVENAVRHGLEPAVDGGSVTVAAQRDGDRLVLRVADTGIGWRAVAHEGTAGGSGAGRTPAGFGLEQVRERLHTLYGDAATLTIESPRADTGMGVMVTLALPIHPASSEEPPT